MMAFLNTAYYYLGSNNFQHIALSDVNITNGFFVQKHLLNGLQGNIKITVKQFRGCSLMVTHFLGLLQFSPESNSIESFILLIPFI